MALSCKCVFCQLHMDVILYNFSIICEILDQTYVNLQLLQVMI